MTWRIEFRDDDIGWTTEGVGDANEFRTEAAAWKAVDGMREPGFAWAEADLARLRVVRTPTLFLPGDRVEFHPATDLWMRGARYGKVVAAYRYRGMERYRVLVDATGKVVRVSVDNVKEILR